MKCDSQKSEEIEKGKDLSVTWWIVLILHDHSFAFETWSVEISVVIDVDWLRIDNDVPIFFIGFIIIIVVIVVIDVNVLIIVVIVIGIIVWVIVVVG